MVDITKAFYDRIKASPTIIGLVEGRIYNDALRQGSPLPAIVYWAISERVFADLQGAVGMDQVTFQVNAYGATRTEANNLAWELWRHLDGYMGIQGDVLIKDLSRGDGISHVFDEPSGGTDQRRFLSVQDFVVTYDSIQSFIA